MRKSRTVSKSTSKPAAKVPPTDAELEALHWKHVSVFEKILVKKDDLKLEIKAFKELLKNDGDTMSAVKLSVELKTPEGQAIFQARIAEHHRIAEWNGVGIQIDMPLGAGEPKDAVFEEGRRAALQDLPARAPEHHRQKAAARWLDGFHAGRMSLNTERLGNVKKLEPPKKGEGLKQRLPTFREAAE
jgi:hypothetical protein